MSVQGTNNLISLTNWENTQKVFKINQKIAACCSLRIDSAKAQEHFQEFKIKKLDPNIESYLFLIESFIGDKKYDSALASYFELKNSSIKPSKKIYFLAVFSYIGQGLKNEVISILSEMKKELIFFNIIDYNNLLKFAIDKEDYEIAFYIFKDLLELGLKPTIYTYEQLIRGSLNEKNYFGIDSALEEMKKLQIKPNLLIYNYCMTAFNKRGDYLKTKEIYKIILKSNFMPNGWTESLICNALVLLGEIEEAKKHFMSQKDNILNFEFVSWGIVERLDVTNLSFGESLIEIILHMSRKKPLTQVFISSHMNEEKKEKLMFIFNNITKYAPNFTVKPCSFGISIKKLY